MTRIASKAGLAVLAVSATLLAGCGGSRDTLGGRPSLENFTAEEIYTRGEWQL